MEGSWRFRHKTQDFANCTAAHLFILIGYPQQVMHENLCGYEKYLVFSFYKNGFHLNQPVLTR